MASLSCLIFWVEAHACVSGLFIPHMLVAFLVVLRSFFG